MCASIAQVIDLRKNQTPPKIMKKIVVSVLFMIAIMIITVRAVVLPPPTYQWNFDITNVVSTTTNVFTTIPGNNSNTNDPQGYLVQYVYNSVPVSSTLLGAPGSGVSSGIFPSLPYDRAIFNTGTYNISAGATLVCTPGDAYAITNLGYITKFTFTCWAKSDSAGNFVAANYPRIIGMGRQNMDAGDGQGNGTINELGMLFFNAGDFQLKINAVNAVNGANNGMSTTTLPLASAATNWVFIAVTYDCTVQTGGTNNPALAGVTNLVMYFGDRVDSLLAPTLAPTVQIIATNYCAGALTVNSNLPGVDPNSPGPLNWDRTLTNNLVPGVPVTGVTNVYVYIGNRISDYHRVFYGRYDDMRFFANQVLTKQQVEAVRTNGNPGFATLSILQQPVGSIVFAGQQLEMNVVASEAPARTYQWYRQAPGSSTSNLLSGATSASFVTPPLAVLTDDGAIYWVHVTSTDPVGIVTSIVSTGALIHVVSAANAILTPGMLKFEYYANIAGATVASLTNDANFPAIPDLITYTPSFDTRPVFPDDTHFNYGVRLSGFITPTVSTNYVFYVRASDQADLYLSTDNTTNNLAMIASDSVSSRQVFLGPESALVFPGPTAPCSTTIQLQAGTSYAVQLLLKSQTGVNFAQVAWKQDSGHALNTGGAPNAPDDISLTDWEQSDRLQPIPAAVLSAYSPSNSGTVSITSQPTGGTVVSNSRVTLNIGVSASGAINSPLVVQWQKNGTNILGATGTSYTTPYLTATANYRAVASIPGAVTNSQTVTVTVSGTANPPTIVNVTPGDSMRSATVQFSEPVDPGTGLIRGNYTIPGLTVTNVSYASNTNLVQNPLNDAVTLMFSNKMADGTAYTLTVNNVKDSTLGATIAGSTSSFTSYTLAAGWCKMEYYENQTPNMNIEPISGISDDGTAGWIMANSVKVNHNDPDTIVFPTSLHYSPQGGSGTRDGAATGYVPPYVTVMKTFITPTNTGNYVFYISADDSGILWLSTNDAAANKHVIAYQETVLTPTTTGTGEQTWTTNAFTDPNTSSATMPVGNVAAYVGLYIPGATPWPVTSGGFAVITLQAGQRYYLEADHRTQGLHNNGYCAVTWDNGSGTVPADYAPILSGSAIGWPFPASAITSFTKTGSNVNISWGGAGNVYKGAIGYPGLGQIDSSYPSGGALQSASVVTGPYTTLTNTSPATFPATNSAQFFRVSQ
jgi:hypothetical protein